MTAPAPYRPNQDPRSFDDDPAIERQNQAMIEDGVKLEEVQYVDTFDFVYRDKFEIPNSGGQWLEFERMNEGTKSYYQSQTNNEVRIQRSTGDTKMKFDPGRERHVLIRVSVKDWHLVRRRPGNKGGWETVPFSKAELDNWLSKANPAIIQDLEKVIRDANPWMQAEMTVEGIDQQIRDLEERREALLEEEAKKS